MGQIVGAAVENVVVLALVDAYAPEHDTGVIAVLEDHLPHVLHRLILPGLVADVLPAGNLGEDQQAQLVAGVDKMLTLRIMGGAHGVAGQLLLQDTRILKLQVRGGGVADVGIALVPVQAPQEALLPVEVEAVGLKFDGAEAHAVLHPVEKAALSVQQLRPAGVELGLFRAPALGPGDADGEAVPAQLTGEDLIAVQNAQPRPGVVALDRELGLQPVIAGRHRVEIGDIAPLTDVQPDLPVQSAVGQIVDHKAEGRDGGVLRAVETDGQLVLRAVAHEIADLHPEGGVAAAVLGAFDTVTIHRGDVGGTVKLQKEALAPIFGGDVQLPPVAGDHLVVPGPGIMQGTLLYRVGQADRTGCPLKAHKVLRPGFAELPVVAQADHACVLP